jgi:hypothetical protein
MNEIWLKLANLKPADYSVLMFIFMCVDLWAAIILSVKRGSFVSKRLIKGALFNLLIVMLPLVVAILFYLLPTGEFLTVDRSYGQVISAVVCLLYVSSSTVSIITNYSAANPEASNFLARFARKYLPNELLAKEVKHTVDTPIQPEPQTVVQGETYSTQEASDLSDLPDVLELIKQDENENK